MWTQSTSRHCPIPRAEPLERLKSGKSSDLASPCTGGHQRWHWRHQPIMHKCCFFLLRCHCVLSALLDTVNSVWAPCVKDVCVCSCFISTLTPERADNKLLERRPRTHSKVKITLTPLYSSDYTRKKWQRWVVTTQYLLYKYEIKLNKVMTLD